MKPKNKFQEQIIAFSKQIPSISKTQKDWAIRHCFDRYARKTPKGRTTCLECGHTWQSEPNLVDTLCGCTCPHCGEKLIIENTRNYVFRENQYFGIINTFKGMQVLRYFFFSSYLKVGQQASYKCHEVVQHWIAPDGKNATVSLLRKMSPCFYDLWDYGSSFEIRREHHSQSIIPAKYNSRQRFLPEIKKGGFTGNYHNLYPHEFFRTLLSSCRAETLLKTGQIELFRYFAQNKSLEIDRYWASMIICKRHKYEIKNFSYWCDYIDLLRFFKKDLHSPKYVCPENIQEEHDRYVHKKMEWEKKQKLEKRLQKIQDDENKFRKMKAKFFGMQFTDGEINVRVLESIQEFYEEGTTMRHCVFSNEYYLKPDSLVLSAYTDNEKLETIEIRLSTMEIVQSHGVCNKDSEYHDRIIKLVDENINLIRKKMVA